MKNLTGIACLLVVVLLLIGFALTSVHANPQVGAVPASTENGRYQLVAPSDNVLYLIDTRTGQTWRRGFYLNGNTAWKKLESVQIDAPVKQ